MLTIKKKNENIWNGTIRQSTMLKIFNIITVFPLFTVVTLFAFYFMTALEIGALPTYGNPDPKCTIFAPLMWFILSGIIFSISTLPVWIAIATYFSKKLSIKLLIPNLALFVVPIIIFLFINFATPIMEWFLD